jgi:hypothetical protein
MKLISDVCIYFSLVWGDLSLDVDFYLNKNEYDI